MTKETNNTITLSVANSDRIRWARGQFVEESFKELALLFAKADELSEQYVFWPLDRDIIGPQPCSEEQLLAADDAACGGEEEQLLIDDAVMRGEEGNIRISLSDKELIMNGKAYALDSAVIKFARYKSDDPEYLYLKKGQKCHLYAHIGGDGRSKQAFLQNKESGESAVEINEFCMLSALKNDSEDLCDTYIFTCFSSKLGVIFAQVIQRLSLCTALDLIRGYEGFSRVLQHETRAEFRALLSGLVQASGNGAQPIDKWNAEYLPETLDDYRLDIENSLPLTCATKRALAKYIIAKTAEKLFDAEIIGILSIVNTKREKATPAPAGGTEDKAD